MSHTGSDAISNSWSSVFQVRLYSLPLAIVWALTILVTISIEVLPIPAMAPLFFYGYCSAKAILFLTLGFLTPLTFARFRTLNSRILAATLSAVAIEALQGLVRHGHSFHWYEVALKLLVIFIGFSCGIVARYDRGVSLGRLHVLFTSNRA